MPKAELGFLGSCFFIGVIFSIYYVPRLSDEYGRLTYIKQALIIQIMSQFGFILSTNIYQAYMCMLMMGLTFPGKSIVYYNYAIELTIQEHR